VPIIRPAARWHVAASPTMSMVGCTAAMCAERRVRA
jgi:hypothetical protein